MKSELFGRQGKRYLSVEMASLGNGDSRTVRKTCGPRHTISAISVALTRHGPEERYRNGVPKTLYDLCLEAGAVGGELKESNRRMKLIRALAGLPNACFLDRQQWLETPEFWLLFEDWKRNALQSERYGRVLLEVAAGKAAWCDRWVRLSDADCPRIRRRLDRLYVFPGYGNGFGPDEAFVPASMTYRREDRYEAAEDSARTAATLKGRVPVGFISYRTGIPVAALSALLQEK